jgi:5-carboxymethyl-2-hydroxymuconate isomerase
MKLVTFSHNGKQHLGEWIDNGEQIHRTAWPTGMLAAIERGMTPTHSGEIFATADVKLEAPFRPGKILAIGLNYADHAAETNSAIPDHPLVFAKFPSAVIGYHDPIQWSKSITNEVDWEVELAVIVGKRARHIAKANAFEHIYGYTVANDVSARDLQKRIDQQWTRGKSLDTFCPLGPVVVTRDEIADPQNLNLKTTVNGEVMQQGTTSQMIFDVATLVEYLSQNFTLEPGDIILTGTPPGVGAGKNPPQYLKDGDTVACSIEGIGELVNPVQVVD